MPLLSLYWKVHDATIGVLATLSKITSLVIISMAPNGWVLFLGACCGFLSSLAAIVIRSMLSKYECVHHSENSPHSQGGDQSGAGEGVLPAGQPRGCCSSLCRFVTDYSFCSLPSPAPLFTEVYNNTLSTFPGAVFLVQASLFVVSC